jgi:DtxR family transcriptional regulator, manganese transport regulator
VDVNIVARASADASRTAAERVAATGFRRQRQQRHSMLLEDYVEVISELLNEFGEARTIDVARRFGVTHSTATKAIGRLARNGLIHMRPYRGMFLTDAGRELAQRAQRRNAVVRRFLIAIGVSAETATIDAEGIEHHVSNETLAALERVTAALARTRGRKRR